MNRFVVCIPLLFIAACGPLPSEPDAGTLESGSPEPSLYEPCEPAGEERCIDGVHAYCGVGTACIDPGWGGLDCPAWIPTDGGCS